jgi:catechol 2,3-dioxygenase-like lactoylglutathione lyase family enzyme
MPGLAPFHHAKLPVSDVVASSEWYRRVLGLEVEVEFEEEGKLMGVALIDATSTPPLRLALRLDPERAAALAGFDPVALGVPTRAEVAEWAARLDAAGVRHGGVVRGHNGGAVLVGLHDPDGIELRLYAE